MSVKGDTEEMIDALREVGQLYYDICDTYNYIPEFILCCSLCEKVAGRLEKELEKE